MKKLTGVRWQSFSFSVFSALALCGCLNLSSSGITTKGSFSPLFFENLDISYTSGRLSAYVNQAFESAAPSINKGKISQCTISPALPVGLSIAPTTCQITGTPSAISPETEYQVIATTTLGSAAVNLKLEVLNKVPEISFLASPYQLELLHPSTLGAPLNKGGVITGCIVSPALPSGLSIGPNSCVISGTPTTVRAATNYTITPSNAEGAGSAVVISLAVTSIVPHIDFEKNSYEFSLHQAGATTGAPISTGGAITSCTISPPLPAGLSVNQSTCAVSGTPNAVVSAQTYTLTPKNSVGEGRVEEISIEVSNTVPNITYARNSFNFSLNFASSTTGAPVNSGGAIQSCTVSPLLPIGLVLDSNTCSISGTPTILIAQNSYVITPKNAVGPGPARTIEIAVSNVVPNIHYSNNSYSFNYKASGSTTGFPANIGGTITGCTVVPALPAGLALSAGDCSIAGTPSAVTPATNYSVTPSNGIGSGTPVVVSLTVKNIAPNISYSANSYTYSLHAAVVKAPTNIGGAITNCTITPQLPAGLGLNATTCEISGSPSAVSAAQSYIVSASNSIGNAPDVTISITIANTVPNLSFTSAVYNFDLGEKNVNTGVIVNSGGTVTNCTVSPVLPAGLTIDPTSCVILGTPSVLKSATNYTVIPSNAAGNGTAKVLSITVKNIAPNIAYSAQSYSFNLNGVSTTTVPLNSGGAITSCTITPALPMGLVLSQTTCEISGTPSALKSATLYTITASNGVGSGAARTITLTVH